jgi:sugar lactone lactonase YvrE
VKKRSYPAIAAMVIPLLAACSSASSPTPTVQSAAANNGMIASPHIGFRFGLSQQALEAALQHRGRGDASSAKTQATLFISDLGTESVKLYPANAKKPKQSGSITDGIDQPVNAAVDASGTLYVANNGNNTVTEYPLGASSPSVTLSTDIVSPNGIAVDSAGTVYVTSGEYFGQGYVLVFPKGASTPSEQINGFVVPIGLAVNKKGDLFVADYQGNAVYEVPKGTTTPENLNLAELDAPMGVAIDQNGHLWALNYNNAAALEYKIGNNEPIATVNSGLSESDAFAFGRNGRMYVANTSSDPTNNVVAFKKKQTDPYAWISADIPVGVAAYPPPQK